MPFVADSEISTADLFWREFMKHEPIIKKLIYNRTDEDNQVARDIMCEIIDAVKLEGQIDILFGVGLRNGMSLPERRDYIELIITPIYQRKNKNLVISLFDSHKKYLSDYWCVIKYKIWQHNNINFTLNYDGKLSSKNIIEITKYDFQFSPIIDKDSQKLNILLFINNSKAEYLIKKEKYEINGNVRNIWVPVDCGIYSILENVIGEYHLLNTLDKMEIYLNTEEIEITDRQPIEKMKDVVDMIANNPLSGVYNCARCNHLNKQTSLKLCKCKNVYYCDVICQRAHRNLHKLNCSAIL